MRCSSYPYPDPQPAERIKSSKWAVPPLHRMIWPETPCAICWVKMILPGVLTPGQNTPKKDSHRRHLQSQPGITALVFSIKFPALEETLREARILSDKCFPKQYHYPTLSTFWVWNSWWSGKAQLSKVCLGIFQAQASFLFLWHIDVFPIANNIMVQ